MGVHTNRQKDGQKVQIQNQIRFPLVSNYFYLGSNLVNTKIP